MAIRQIMLDNQDCDLTYLECEKGCILNFLDHIKENGRIPIVVDDKDGELFWTEESNCHKPCLAQHLAFILQQTDNKYDWIEPELDNMERFVCYYMENCRHKETGLYYWLDDLAIGVDNDPATFYRPKKSSASIYLNCLMYKELRAMEYICDVAGRNKEKYATEAEALKQAIQEHLWDEKCGFYFSANLNLLPVDTNQFLHSGMPRHWNCVIERIDVWSGFMAMWAGIATKEQAERMIKENMLNEKTFWSLCGVRSLSKLEKMYTIAKSGNPSCWLGPIWGIVNYMCFQGLLRYGYEKEATELAKRTIAMFGRDIEACGEMHEYYHPDTGEGVINQGFQCWNLLVNNMIAYVEGRERVSEY